MKAIITIVVLSACVGILSVVSLIIFALAARKKVKNKEVLKRYLRMYL
jgi:hypothetical protein